MTIVVSIHQPNKEIIEMFDSIYILAKGGTNLYCGHPSILSIRLKECGINCDGKIEVDAILGISHNNDDKCSKMFYFESQTKNDLKNRIFENELIERRYFRSSRKRFYLADTWILLQRKIRYTYLAKWKFILLQFFIYTSLSIILRIHFSSKITEPDGCLEIGFADLTNNCNQTLEDLENEYLLKQNFKYIYLITVMLSLFIMVFVIVSFVDEIKVIENEYNNSELTSFHLSSYNAKLEDTELIEKTVRSSFKTISHCRNESYMI